MSFDPNGAARLRALLDQDICHIMPCCFDALSAKLIEQEGFALTFMSGFAASASRIGAPDLGLMSYGEVVDHVRNIRGAISIPLLADGDTGYGNAMNVIRTVTGFAEAGCAAVMIEDQLAPKRCGHTPGKDVVGRQEAFDRIRAAVDAQAALQARGLDICILARTDARHTLGLSESIARSQKFAELGADILFVEAPADEAEMAQICRSTPKPQLANMLEGGKTPVLPNQALQQIGFKIAAYPLTMMSSAMAAMISSLRQLRRDEAPDLLSFDELRQRIGFDDYYGRSARYQSAERATD